MALTSTPSMETSSYTNMPSASILGELGHVGLKSYSGVIKEDFHKELNYPQAAKTFKMMTYDSTVASALTMIKAIAKNSKCHVHVPEGASEEKGKFIEECMHDMDESWRFYVNEFFSILTYGFSVNEIVFKKRSGFNLKKSKSSKYEDGLIGWAKLPSRAQSSISKWYWDETGTEIVGVKQKVGTTEDAMAKGYASEVNIPRPKFLLFRYDPELNNPEGNSPLKRCYINWKYKTAIEEYEAIGISRDLQGMPLIHLPPEYMSADASPSQKALYEYMKTVVRNITANEQAGLIMPKFVDPTTKADLFQFELVSSSGGGKSYDTNQILQRYDHRILMSFLADVLILGGDSVGSYSLASSKEAAILKMVELAFSHILDEINEHLIPMTFRANGWDDKVFPEIRLDSLDPESLDEVGKYIQRLATTGAIELDKPLSDYLRSKIGLDGADLSDQIREELVSNSKSDASRPSREDASKDNSTNNTENAE